MPIFGGAKRWGIIFSTLVLASLLLSACGGNPPSILDTAGPVAAQEAVVFWFILIVATVVFVVVETLLIWFTIRYRARPGSPRPRQIYGNNGIELAWTIIPSVILFGVLIFTIFTMFNLTQPPGRALNVKVIGHQWWWEFQYENDHITTADELVVPINTVVHLDLESENVIHSFWVPQLTGKTDVVPGHHNDKWFQADRTGYYRGQCTEFCGLEHANMELYVKALSSADYASWLIGEQQKAQASNDANAQAGEKLFTGSAGCFACHGIVGVDMSSFDDPKAAGFIGPNLTHFGSRRQIAGGVLEWNPNSCVVQGTGDNARILNQNACNLYKWLHDPQAVKPGNDMNIGTLSDSQIAQLVAYLKSLI